MRVEATLRRGGVVRGFTLVELLVVIAVIAILASLMFPALVRARGMAQQARCISQIRQYALAAQLYWDDHAGVGFPERVGRWEEGWTYWFGWLADGQEGRREFDPTRGPLWVYLGSRELGVCAALRQDAALYKGKATGAASGYGYNLTLGPRNGSPINLCRVGAPAELAVFADCAQVNDFLAPATPEQPLLEEFYYFDTNTAAATVHFRHSKRAAAAMADGHVSMELPEAGSLDTRLSGQTLGRMARARIEVR